MLLYMYVANPSINFRNKYLKYKIKYLKLKYDYEIPFDKWPEIELLKTSDYIKKYKIYKKKYMLLKEEKEEDSDWSVSSVYF